MCTGLLASSMADLAFDFVSSREPARDRPWPLPSPDPPASCASAACPRPSILWSVLSKISQRQNGAFGKRRGCSCRITGDGYVFDAFGDVKERIVASFGQNSLVNAFPGVSCIWTPEAKRKGPPSHVANWRSIVSGTSDSVASTMRRGVLSILTSLVRRVKC